MKDRNCDIIPNLNYIIISLIILVALTLIVMYVPNCRIFDIRVLTSVKNAMAPFSLQFPLFLSSFGMSDGLRWAQIAACCTLISHRKYFSAVLLVIFTRTVFIVTLLIKNFVCRERPGLAPEYSFPSGHSSAMMCFLGILIYLVNRYVEDKFWKEFLTLTFGCYIFLVAFSRLWLGVHFLTDVIAGLLLGFILVNIYIILIKIFNH